ncbi:MAG: gliding motility-associated C-terminal domain-containing protein, partial [Bacteroidia bacterium]|nr:gliding motility-associated C-terminal domain-containing protein [Bacteroidia bacterium]
KILNTCQVTASPYSIDVCTRPPTPEIRIATVTATGTIAGANQIQWIQPNFNGAITQYELYHRPNNTGPWNLIATFSTALSGLMTYTHTTVNTQTQTNAYLVRTYDNCAKVSEDSPIHESINLSTSTPAIKTVKLDWTAYQGWKNGVLRYVILRKNASSSVFTAIDSVPGNTLTYSDVQVSCSQTYIYKILARENGGNLENSYSDEESAQPYDNTPVAPAYLRSVSVSKTDEINGEITLRMDASPDYRRKAYRIYRGVNSSTPVYVGDYINPASGVLTFTDTGLNTKQNTYTYYITVTDSCNNPESVPTTAHTTMNLTATGSLGAILLSWTPYIGFPVLDKYIIERSKDGINYLEIDTLPAHITQTTDTVSCVPYYYRIRAAELGGNAEFSYSDTSGARAIDPIPPQINFLRRVTVLTTSATNGSVQLDWELSPSKDVKKYLIYRKESSSPSYTLIGFTNSTTKTYTDFGLNTRDLTYDYKIQVLDSCDNVSAEYTTVHTTINITAVAGEEKNIISWTPYGGWQVDQYLLFRNGVPIKTFGPDERFYIDTNVVCKKKYNYQVKALELGGLNEVSYSDTSAAIPYKLRLPESKYLARVTVVQDKEVLIQWTKTKEKGAVFYRIYRKVKDTGTWTLLHTTATTNDTAYTDKAVEVDKHSYVYQITVVDECGNESLRSNEAQTILLSGYVPKPFQNQLHWTNYREWKGNVEKYEVYRRVPNGTYTAPIFVGSSLELSYLDDKLIDSDGAFYVYKIVAYEGTGGLNQVSESNEITLVQEPTLFVPTAFTPNGDGQNDLFDIKGVYICEFDLQIFDRWGNVVFSSQSLDHKWDGSVKGEISPVSVFAYIVKVKSCTGKLLERAGTVTVIR